MAYGSYSSVVMACQRWEECEYTRIKALYMCSGLMKDTMPREQVWEGSMRFVHGLWQRDAAGLWFALLSAIQPTLNQDDIWCFRV